MSGKVTGSFFLEPGQYLIVSWPVPPNRLILDQIVLLMGRPNQLMLFPSVSPPGRAVPRLSCPPDIG